MTYRLYHQHRSASTVIHVLLEAIGEDYTLIDAATDRSVPRPAEQLAVNPNGWIPVLLWEGGAMYEAAAITIFLTDRHPTAKLGPKPDDPTRPLFLQTLVYLSSSVQTAFQMTYYPDRFVDAEEDEPSAKRRSILRLRETLGVVNDQIGSQDWVLGNEPSAVDMYLSMLTTWLSPSKGHPTLSEFPNIARIAKATARLPAMRRVYEDGSKE